MTTLMLFLMDLVGRLDTGHPVAPAPEGAVQDTASGPDLVGSEWGE